MKVLVILLVALLFPLIVSAQEKMELEQPTGRHEAVKSFANAFLVQFAPELRDAMLALEGKIRELTTSSGDLFLNQKNPKLFIETTDPESKIVADLRRQKDAPLIRWEARGNFDYVKGGLELNFSQTFGRSTKVALRGLVTQEFFEPLDPKYEISAKVIYRF